MDIESGLELRKIPLYAGEASLPPPPPTKNRRNPEDDDKYLVEIPPWTIKEIVVASMATVVVILSIIIILIPYINPFVFITGILGVIVPPYAALQEQKITDCKAIQETNEAMEREVHNMKIENERLSLENDKLEASVSKIQQSKDVLAECRRTNTISLSNLETQLQESQLILNQMETNKRAELIDNIFEVISALDDGDFTLSDDEIDLITKKIESIQGVEIRDHEFKQRIIKAGRNIEAVMRLLNDLLDDDPNTAPEDEKIITFL